MLHACLLPITLCSTVASWCFYWFPATNILTRCQSVGSCFLLFLVSEKLHRKYYEVLHRKTPEARRRAGGGPQGGHTPLGAPYPLAAPGGGVGPLDRLRLRLFAYLFTPDGKTLDIAQKFQKEVRSRRHRLGEIRSSSRHSAGGEIITGGLLHHHARLRSDVWVVHHRTTGPWQ